MYIISDGPMPGEAVERRRARVGVGVDRIWPGNVALLSDEHVGMPQLADREVVLDAEPLDNSACASRFAACTVGAGTT
jgi:hypothetical protein